MTLKEFTALDSVTQSITPAPLEYVTGQLGNEKCESICRDIHSVLKKNELSVEQAEMMLDFVKARLKKTSKV